MYLESLPMPMRGCGISYLHDCLSVGLSRVSIP